ncbi:MAG: hypothetical protein HYZ51_00340 [Candidatus Doudnabacteria bacterium]|nr:hypothetical protein [Candidatus Doudnabacteria bacterium]
MNNQAGGQQWEATWIEKIPKDSALRKTYGSGPFPLLGVNKVKRVATFLVGDKRVTISVAYLQFRKT